VKIDALLQSKTFSSMEQEWNPIGLGTVRKAPYDGYTPMQKRLNNNASSICFGRVLVRSQQINHWDLWTSSISQSCCTHAQARNQFGTPGVAKSFLRGAQIFQTMSNIFQLCPAYFTGGRKGCRRASPPWAPLVTGLPILRGNAGSENESDGANLRYSLNEPHGVVGSQKLKYYGN